MLWSEDDIREFGRQVADLVAGYYASLESRPVVSGGREDLDRLFAGPLPEEGTDPFALLAEVRTRVVPAAFHLASPRYFGLFNPTPTVIGVYADAIASLINQNMGAWCHGPSGAHMEKAVIRWLCDLAGYGPDAFGTLTSGGTLANYTALKVALNETVPGVRRHGVTAAGGHPIFYVSTQAHYSLDRLANLLGIGLDGMVRIECDDAARILPDLLERRIEADRRQGRLPFCVVGIAGTTTSGAVDPLPDLADVCARHGLWYHVDAAWGGAVRLSPARSGLLDGIERADSVTLDPHKWFSVPFTAGAVITRDGGALRRTFEVEPAYLTDRGFSDHEDLNLYQFGVAGTRRLDALKVWMSLRQYGRRGYADAIERQIGLAERLAAMVADAEDFEPMSLPSLGVFCFRYLPAGGAWDDEGLDRYQMRLQEAVTARGRVWLSTSVLAGRRVFRFCATSYLTRERHLDDLIGELRAASRHL